MKAPDTVSDIEQLGIVRPRGFPGLPAGWRSEWETFPSSDGRVQLFAVTHHKEPWTSGRVLVILHGHGEHGGRYFHVPHYLKDIVDAVYCLDQRGHGRAEGLRGHVDRFDIFAEDAAAAIRRLDEQLKKRFGKSEIHLWGHSLGGHVALRTLLLHPELPVASVTVTAPFLGIKQNVPFVKRAAAKVLSNLWGSLQLPTGLDPNNISRDPEVVQAYESDRLMHDKMTPRMYTDMQRAIQDTLSRNEGIRPPLQVIVPLADQIIDSEETLKYYRALRHPEKRLRTYEGCYHEPHNDLCKDELFADLAAWIREHSKSS